MHIWIVQGCHAIVPGVTMSAYATKAGADSEAASLVTIMLKDAGLAHLIGSTSARNWKRVLKEAQRVSDGYDVWITKLEVK